MVTSTDAPREMQLKDAKARFSAVVDAAEEGAATVVTRHGKPAAVVIGVAEWERLKGAAPSFLQHLLAFPIDDGDEVFERDQTPMRDIDF
jgi:prevent-host-death family protein